MVERMSARASIKESAVATDMDVFVNVPSVASILTLDSKEIIRNVEIRDWHPEHYNYGSHRRQVLRFEPCFACGHEWPMLDGLGVAWATSKGLAKWTRTKLYCKPCFDFPHLKEIAYWGVEFEYVEIPAMKTEQQGLAGQLLADRPASTLRSDFQGTALFESSHSFPVLPVASGEMLQGPQSEPARDYAADRARIADHVLERNDTHESSKGSSRSVKLAHIRSLVVLESAATSSKVQYSYIGSSSSSSIGALLPPPALLAGFLVKISI